MSDESAKAPPKEITSQPSAEVLSNVQTSSDSAAPPSSHSESQTTAVVPKHVDLPPKDYFAPHQRATVAPPVVQTLRPNSSIPAFLRLLAFVLFLGGSTAAGIAWVYKNIFYPKLVIALKAKTDLHLSHLVSYEKLLGKIRSLVEGPGYSLIAPRLPVGGDGEALGGGGATAGEKKVKFAEGTKEGSVEEVGTEGEEEEKPSAPPPPQIFVPLTNSLQSLSSAINSDNNITSLDTDSTRDNLKTSITSLNDWLSAETIASMSSAYRTQIPSQGGANGREQRAFFEAVAGLKAEIRQVKGALLNRRNFAALVPRAGVTNPTAA
ncbi:hypothetical protein T439DRAFT_378376 [Meredithblackwellia eburnea MCA 4105]